MQQILVHGMAHLLHDLEANRRVQLRLREVKPAADCGDTDHAADEPEQVRGVSVRKRIVDQLLD